MGREEKLGLISIIAMLFLAVFFAVFPPKSPKEIQGMLDEQVLDWLQDTRLVEYEVAEKNGEEVCSFIVAKKTTSAVPEEMQLNADLKACEAFENTGVEIVDVGMNKFLTVREMKFHLATGIEDVILKE